MSDFQQRVIDEKNDLNEKREKLLMFFNTDIFRKLDQNEKDRLRLQYSIMCIYYDILQQRILNFQIVE